MSIKQLGAPVCSRFLAQGNSCGKKQLGRRADYWVRRLCSCVLLLLQSPLHPHLMQCKAASIIDGPPAKIFLFNDKHSALRVCISMISSQDRHFDEIPSRSVQLCASLDVPFRKMPCKSLRRVSTGFSFLFPRGDSKLSFLRISLPLFY